MINKKLFKTVFSLSLKELLNKKQLIFFMVLNLFLGLISFTLIDSFKVSLSNHIDKKSQVMFTADLRVSGRRLPSSQEMEYFESSFSQNNITQKISFFTMSRSEEKNKLVEMVIIDQKFPLYGEIVYEDFQGNIVDRNQASQILSSPDAVAIYPTLKFAYDLKQDDFIQLGDEKYKAKLIVKKDVGGSFNFSGLAPKVYIFKNNFETEKLSTFGNLVRYRTYLSLDNNLDKNSLENFRKNLFDDLQILKAEDASPFVVRSHSGSGSQIESILRYVSNYLSLISLIALFLSGVGMAYLFHNFIHGKIKTTAIIRSLGLTQNQTFLISVIQLMIIGLFASIFSSVLSYFLVPFIPNLFSDFLPDGFVMIFSFRSVLLTYVISVIGAVLFCLPILIANKDLSLGYLFSGRVRYSKNQNIPLILTGMGIALSFYVMSSWLAQDWFVGLIFSGTFFGLFLLLFLIGISSASALKLLFSKTNFINDFAIKSIHFNKFSTIFFFLSLSLGTMLITSITQMEKSISAEIKQPEGVVFPTFFLFNISDENIGNITEYVSERGYSLDNASAIIGARLLKINDEELKPNDSAGFDVPDEEQWRGRDNRRINLSYREGLIKGEEILKGVPFEEATVSTGKFKLSVEDGYAQERNVSIGDTLLFQGLDLPNSIEAEVVNIREVKWNQFQPNFWLILEPSAVENVPKMYLASISSVPDNDKQTLQSDINARYPNVSLLDVKAVIEEVLNLVNQVGILVKVMAVFSIILGLFILFSIVHHQSRSKWKEINMLKVLGLNFQSIRKLVAIEYLILGSYSIIMGMLLGIVYSFVISTAFFEGSFTLGIWEQVIMLTVLIISIQWICLFAIRKPLSMPANSLLKENAI